MKDAANIERRFGELAAEAARVLATKQRQDSDWGSGEYIDPDLELKWRVNARHLIQMVGTETSQHFIEFVRAEEPGMMETNFRRMTRLQAVFAAAHDDFKGGYFAKYRALIQAEVFSTELDQATELLSASYKSAAAVIAGVVLETALRDLCARNGVPPGKIDKMNADLVKTGVYTLLVQKRITALADIRNSAAHGHPDRFDDDDVSDMIGYIERFLGEHL